MAVFRVERNSNYTTMCNHHLRDHSLSLKAKGLLSQFLSLPDTWHYSVAGLVAINKDGKAAVESALWELEKCGYVHRKQLRDKNGRLSTVEYTIYEMPHKAPSDDLPLTENPSAVSPSVVSPPVDFDPRIITNRTNTEKINGLKEKDTRHKYGAYQNVLLTDEELEKLKAEFPADWQERLERLSEYIASSGKHYKNHLATLRSWARRDKPKTAAYSHSNYTCAEGDSL